MTRNRFRLGFATVFLVVLCVAPAVADPQDRIQKQLAVQDALAQANKYLKEEKFAAAVAVLEPHVGNIDGSKRYLDALRDAYRGYIADLANTGKLKEAEPYRERLRILEPGTRAVAPPHTLGQRPQALPTSLDPPGLKEQPITPRAKITEIDPFSDKNAVPQQARSLVAKAEKAFLDKQYESACDLYAHADYADGKVLTGEMRERWAYCRLYRVATAMKNAAGAPTPALEREVQQAVLLAPKLSNWGDELLRKARDGEEAAIAVKHGPKQASGWASAETTNFRLFHQTTPEQAEKLVRVAEATRAKMTRHWFNEEPTNWSPRCDIYLHADGEAYAKATKAHTDAPGHASLSVENGRVVLRRLDFPGDNAALLTTTLPHETTHVVFAGRFGHHHVPRWADEGMAALSEPRERVQAFLRNLPQQRREGKLFAVSRLLSTTDWPDARLIDPFYSQSISVVEFLVKKRDPLTFTRFVRAGLDSGYESALTRFYGYRSFTELERDWMASTFGDDAVATAEKRKTK